MTAEIKNKYEKSFILEITKALMNIQGPQNLLIDMTEIFRKFMGIETINFCVLDYNTGTFKDFVRDWVYIEDKNKHMYLYNIFKQIQNTKDHFIINGRLSSYSPDSQEMKEIENIAYQENNLIYFPLISKLRTFGMVEIYYKELKENIKMTPDFISTLQVIFLEISTAVNNYILQNHMAKGLNFYDSMKNIAKIIESQYEISYIIPQIGEMIDRFIASHLIYIFLKNADKKFELVWPANCNNPEIYTLIEELNKDVNVLFSQDKQTAVFPLKNEKEIIGVIASYSSIGKLSATELEYLTELTKQASITIQRASAYSEVLKHATLDALTGLNNRRQFDIRIKQETAQSQRKNTPLCGIMLDIDYFKKINDTYGHAAGDCVLKGIANIIINTLREYDIPCRYGGEEFFILLPMTPLDESILVAQRLRKTIQDTQINIREAKIKGVPNISVTASFGVNIYTQGETPEEFYHGADKALYEAKINGRNRVISYKKNNEPQTVVFGNKNQETLKQKDNIKMKKTTRKSKNTTDKTSKNTSRKTSKRTKAEDK